MTEKSMSTKFCPGDVQVDLLSTSEPELEQSLDAKVQST